MQAPAPKSKALLGWSFSPPVPATAAAVEKPKRERKPKAKADPKIVAAARELRDRWLERVNAGAYVFEDAGKYDVSRALPEIPTKPTPAFGCDPRRVLPAA